MSFKPIDHNDIEIDIFKPLELSFNPRDFIEDVLNDEYILVIGSEVIMNKYVEPTGDVNKYILRRINKLSEHKFKDFNELASLGPNIDPVRKLLNHPSFTFDLIDISSELRSFLSTKRFPIVMTTTFDGYLETLMKSIWGNVEVVNIADLESMRHLRNILATYRDKNKYNKPTLIYIFGKAVIDESKKYVLSDDNAIIIIDKWMQLAKQDKIVGLIKDKKVLALGCKFENWYFRFFWYILRREISRFKEGQVAFMIDSNDPFDNKLQSFLEQSRIYRHADARLFMESVTEMLNPNIENNPFKDLILNKRQEGGIFLSYCSKDIVLASQLFFRLSKLGYNVWFDVHNLEGGDKFNPIIREAIAKAKIFVPLLTPTIEQDIINNEYEKRYYVFEWRLAAEFDDKIIIPLAADGYDLKKGYHKSVFQAITKNESTGIDLMNSGGFNKFLLSLTSKLTQVDENG